MPLPTFSQDDYVNWCVCEALSLRMGEEEKRAEEAADLERWRKGELGSGGGPGA